jgi:ribosomal protein S27AE
MAYIYTDPPARHLGTEEQKAILARLLVTRANRHCPRCDNPTFSLLDYLFNLSVPRREIGLPPTAAENIPYVITVCTNCGFMSQHSLGALGIRVYPPPPGV